MDMDCDGEIVLRIENPHGIPGRMNKCSVEYDWNSQSYNTIYEISVTCLIVNKGCYCRRKP